MEIAARRPALVPGRTRAGLMCLSVWIHLSPPKLMEVPHHLQQQAQQPNTKQAPPPPVSMLFKFAPTLQTSVCVFGTCTFLFKTASERWEVTPPMTPRIIPRSR